MVHRKRAVLLAFFFSIVLTTGCSPFVENNTIEEIAPVTFWYVSSGGEGKLKISTLVPPLVKEKKRLLTLQVELVKQGIKQFNLINYRELKAGQTRMLLISEELAKQGVISLINTLLTDPELSQRLYLAVVRGNFEDYIRNQLNAQPSLDYFLYAMLKHYEKHYQGEMTIVNLHQFMKKLYSRFSDPILPVFKANKSSFTYEGTAFFRNDKLAATIKTMDDQLFQLFDNDYYVKILAMPALSVTIGRVRSTVHMELDANYSSLSIKIDLSGRIEEYRGEKNILYPEEVANLTNEIKSYLEKNTKALFKKMQQEKVDPLQVGNLSLHPFAKPLKKEEWSRYWQQMKINVDYQLHLQPLINIKK
ncbi:Ger(x)C family spore germination protein [Brevibacillus massiliensis]|uniref:Ger(x)C family spore germination protein n=1 Tax=Brevibacillus massiliensis TaxID=1118054 RepID=UPI0002F8C354|nr:Ger(x)C family spore germination protein [Brevibacillus massiliensis]